jgi:hypothetical protein
MTLLRVDEEKTHNFTSSSLLEKSALNMIVSTISLDNSGESTPDGLESRFKSSRHYPKLCAYY